MSTKRLIGYDKDANGNLILNPEQAKIVVRLYEKYFSGKTVITSNEFLKKRELKVGMER